jgi:hypothetical protein
VVGTGTGIGVAIDNDYIVLGPSGVHAGNEDIKIKQRINTWRSI